MKKIILFDVGGVLFEWKDKWLFEDISRELKIPSHKIKERFNANISELFVGKVSEKEFWDQILDGEKINPDLISQTFKRRSRLDDKILNLALSLKKNGFDIGILSNITPETKRILSKNWIECFDHVFFSDEIKLAKPDPKIFSYVKEKLPDYKIIFIDDKKENVDTAKKFGIHSILFEESQTMSDDLANLILATP